MIMIKGMAILIISFIISWAMIRFWVLPNIADTYLDFLDKHDMLCFFMAVIVPIAICTIVEIAMALWLSYFIGGVVMQW